MACKIISSEGAVFALWGRPTLADIDDVLSQVRSAAKASGRPVVYVTRVPIDAPPPESDVRQRLNEAMPEIRAVCASYHVILEGDGFLSAVKRAILAGLMQFGWQRDTFFIHASAKQVAFKAPRGYREDVEKILYMAEQQGLLSASAPDEPRHSTFGSASQA
jgi:hypothetical protein